MSLNVIQPSFAAGEISPGLYARTDLAKYHVGAAQLYNFFVNYRGGAITRPGTAYVGQCKYGDRFTRLIPFQFSTIQTYVLEFGDLYMRVIKDGGYVLEPAEAITGITQANPGVVTAVAHGFTAGDWVYLSGISGMTELNGRTLQVGTTTADTFQLRDFRGNFFDTSAFTAYSGAGTVARIFTMSSPYSAAELPSVKFAQSADVMTLTHPSHPPQDLTRTAHYIWTMNSETFGASIGPPTAFTIASAPASTGTHDTRYHYVVTSVDVDGQESLPSAVQAITTDSFDLATLYIALSWTAVSGAVRYNVYKAPWVSLSTTDNVGRYGLVGVTDGTLFEDNNVTQDYSQGPPESADPFAGSNYPSVATYFQQRKLFAASAAEPETIWATQPGLFKNMNKSFPSRDSDAIKNTLASLQVNNIKYMIPMPSGLVVLTGGGAWQVTGGGANAAITPSSMQALPQAYNGCGDLIPIVVNFEILYVQAKGSIVRDLSYNFYANIYTGTDTTVLASHLFLGYTLSDWAYAEEPHKIIWVVRNDGMLLGFTYLKEQDVYGWSRHQTLGLFKALASISEGEEDAVYVIVRRYIGGEWVQYTERFASRLIDNVEDAWAVDCGLQYPLTYPAGTLDASASTGSVTFTSGSAVFGPGDVGKVIRMGGGIAKVTAYTDTSHVTALLSSPITNILQNGQVVQAAADEWSMTAEVTTVTGLWHLEGQTVSILGDGNVFPQQVVTNGAVTLNHASSKITVGLPFTARLQTLNLDTGLPTIQGKRKKIAAVTARVRQTRGLFIGPTFDMLTEFKQRTYEAMGQPIALFTGDERIIMEPQWDVNGQIAIEVRDPLPAEVLGVIPEVAIGDN